MHEREKRAVNWCDLSWEVEISSLRVFLSHFETMLKNAVDHTTNTEGRLNNVRHVFFFHLHFGLVFERDMLLSQNKLFIINFDSDLIISSELV